MLGENTDIAISGLGITRLRGASVTAPRDHAIDAARLAIEDAGITKDQIDGLLFAHSPMAPCRSMGTNLQEILGLRDLNLNQDVHGEGTSGMQMIHNAALYIGAGLAETVLCVFADSALVPGQSFAKSFAVGVPHGYIPGWEEAHGFLGAPAAYGLAARRHMKDYGTTQDHLRAVATVTRKWAGGNPIARRRKPLVPGDYETSPMVVYPFRRLDCAFPVNGGIAVVLTTGDRAKDSLHTPVYVKGIGQGHRANMREAGARREVETSAGVAAGAALEMAGVSIDEIDVCELYDCFTYATIVMLEDLGFCPKGEGGPFVAEGNTDSGGKIPTNTGGGQLSGFYMQAMTPITEGVVQVRGEGGTRQVEDVNLALIHAQGGILDFHACAVFASEDAKDA